MKKLVFLLIPLLLCACSDPVSTRDARRQEGLSALEDDPVLSLFVNGTDSVTEYRLQCRRSEDGDYIESVILPSELAGLCATLSGKKLTLTYRELYFAGETVGLTLPSPLYLYPLAHLALRDGSFVSTSLSGQTGVRDEYLYYYEGDAFTLRYSYEDGKLISVSLFEAQTEYAQILLEQHDFSETSNE